MWFIMVNCVLDIEQFSHPCLWWIRLSFSSEQLRWASPMRRPAKVPWNEKKWKVNSFRLSSTPKFNLDKSGCTLAKTQKIAQTPKKTQLET